MNRLRLTIRDPEARADVEDSYRKTLAGAPLTYGKPGFKNDGFLAWGSRG